MSERGAWSFKMCFSVCRSFSCGYLRFSTASSLGLTGYQNRSCVASGTTKQGMDDIMSHDEQCPRVVTSEEIGNELVMR